MTDALERAAVKQLVAAMQGIHEFFALLDIVEESDSGSEFHPTTISACRATDVPKLEAALAKMRGVLPR